MPIAQSTLFRACIGHRIPCFFLERGTRSAARGSTAVEMKAKKGGSGSGSGPNHTFNSDKSRVLDRGVWKEFKYCSSCDRIFVNRKAFERNWESVKYCSDACRKRSKSNKKQNSAEDSPAA
jgi:hypothetical protein